MNNYDFFDSWVKDQKLASDAKVLDYGCGAGIIVSKLRDSGIEAYGCDIFYEAGDYLSKVDTNLLNSGTIKKIINNTIPFEDNYFDIVVCNQVIEHVKDLDLVLSEIQRVLKPNGKLLSAFPHKEVWREGHCGIAFLHWFPRDSNFRILYATVLRALGFGHFKEGKSIQKWANDFCSYLDNWTHYRSYNEIYVSYSRYFININHIEDYWLTRRLDKYSFLWFIPSFLKRFLATKLAGLVFTSQKSDSLINK